MYHCHRLKLCSSGLMVNAARILYSVRPISGLVTPHQRPRRAGYKRFACTNIKADLTTQERKSGGADIRDNTSSRGLIDTNPPRGTRDFYPEEKRLQTWLFDAFSSVSQTFGFEQVDFPVLESEELFVRKAGEEITDQLYNFEDKGGRRVTLRPELTPSLARIVLQKGKALALPAKWYAIGQCWRYERSTRGRRREHYQWNMDIVGVPGVEAEAELLAAITSFFSKVGLSSADVGIKVSSRKVLQEVLLAAGVSNDVFGAVCVVVDKLEKIPRDKVVSELDALGVTGEAAEKILSALELKSVDDLETFLHSSVNGISGENENPAVLELKRLFSLAEAYGYADYLVFDASVVRGLAYYTGIVFEGFDRAGQLRAICGGGRYDRLLGAFGGEDKPCAGFGFGDAVIIELLKDKNVLPSLTHAVDDLVVPLTSEMRGPACTVAATLRRAGRTVDLALEDKKMKWAFKAAERCGASRLVLVAPEEWERGTVKVKDLTSREEVEVDLGTLAQQHKA